MNRNFISYPRLTTTNYHEEATSLTITPIINIFKKKENDTLLELVQEPYPIEPIHMPLNEKQFFWKVILTKMTEFYKTPKTFVYKGFGRFLKYFHTFKNTRKTKWLIIKYFSIFNVFMVKWKLLET